MHKYTKYLVSSIVPWREIEVLFYMIFLRSKAIIWRLPMITLKSGYADNSLGTEIGCSVLLPVAIWNQLSRPNLWNWLFFRPASRCTFCSSVHIAKFTGFCAMCDVQSGVARLYVCTVLTALQTDSFKYTGLKTLEQHCVPLECGLFIRTVTWGCIGGVTSFLLTLGVRGRSNSWKTSVPSDCAGVNKNRFYL